jgi:hypothetical protein
MEVDLLDDSSSEGRQARRRAKAAMSIYFQIVEEPLDCELRRRDGLLLLVKFDALMLRRERRRAERDPVTSSDRGQFSVK